MKRFIVIGALAAAAVFGGPVGQVRNVMAAPPGANTCTTKICVGIVCTSSVPNMKCIKKYTYDSVLKKWVSTSCSTVGC